MGDCPENRAFWTLSVASASVPVSSRSAQRRLIFTHRGGRLARPWCLRDFSGSEKFNFKVLTPAELLIELHQVREGET